LLHYLIHIEEVTKPEQSIVSRKQFNVVPRTSGLSTSAYFPINHGEQPALGITSPRGTAGPTVSFASHPIPSQTSKQKELSDSET
jgi:hypothetical protein